MKASIQNEKNRFKFANNLKNTICIDSDLQDLGFSHKKTQKVQTNGTTSYPKQPTNLLVKRYNENVSKTQNNTENVDKMKQEEDLINNILKLKET